MPPLSAPDAVHAVVDRLDLFEQRHQARRVGGKLAAEFGGIGAPVARRVDGSVGEAIGMIEPTPIEPIGDAEPGQDRVDRAAGMNAGEIMRAGVEAIDAGAAVVARLAQERVAIAAGDDMRLEHRDLEAGIGEQRRRGEAADPGADDGDVDGVFAARAIEARRRPAIIFGRGDLASRTRRISAFGPKMEASAPKTNTAVVARPPSLSARIAASMRNNTAHKPEISMLTAKKIGLANSAEKAARE